MGVRHKGIETTSGTEGGASAIAHLQAKGKRSRPCVCVTRAARSKSQDHKRARVHTECRGGKTDGSTLAPSDGYVGPPHGPSTTPCTATHSKQSMVSMASIAGPQTCC